MDIEWEYYLWGVLTPIVIWAVIVLLREIYCQIRQSLEKLIDKRLEHILDNTCMYYNTKDEKMYIDPTKCEIPIKPKRKF